MDKKLQIFISSTYADLKEERQAAVQVILSFPRSGVGMQSGTLQRPIPLNPSSVNIFCCLTFKAQQLRRNVTNSSAAVGCTPIVESKTALVAPARIATAIP
ncbi:MAG: DUF4062 domain-containing protein [Methylobacter sp.]